MIEDRHRLRLAGPDRRALGALMSRLVSAAAAGGFDKGQCLPALSDLMPSGFARYPARAAAPVVSTDRILETQGVDIQGRSAITHMRG